MQKDYKLVETLSVCVQCGGGIVAKMYHPTFPTMTNQMMDSGAAEMQELELEGFKCAKCGLLYDRDTQMEFGF